MGQWFQRFIASSIYGEVSDATIQGYLRSAGQIEEVWQQIDDEVDALILQGMAPWDAYARMGYALALVRACRTNIVFVQELLKASASANANAANGNYLPRVTYDQALALCEHIEPYLEEAIKASSNPHYVPTYPFPFAFGPHIRSANQRFPLPHLQGIINAAQQMRDWAAGLLAKYELALMQYPQSGPEKQGIAGISPQLPAPLAEGKYSGSSKKDQEILYLSAAKTPVPQAVSTHLEQMKGELRLGDFHLRTGTDMVGQISQGQVTNELNDKAEGFLWEAMESFFKVSQLVANPALPAPPAQRVPNPVNQQQQLYVRQTSSPEPNPAITAPPALPVQAIPSVPPVPPVPPTPDVSAMLNSVIAEPEPVQSTPTQPSPDISAMLNSVIAEPEPAQTIPAQPSPDVSGMLNSVVAEPTPTRNTPAPPTEDVSDLLNSVITEPGTPQNIPTKPASKGPQVSHPNKAASEDNLLDMLSDICGEQKETD